MKKIDFYEVCELIENSVFVDSTDELRVSDDACSVRITSIGTIDEKGLAIYLFKKLGVSFDVFETDSDEESINEWKEENGVYYYDVQLKLDINIISDIITEKFDVKIYADEDMALIKGDIFVDELLDRLKEYSISSCRYFILKNYEALFEYKSAISIFLKNRK